MDDRQRQDLESKIAFLEHTVDALNGALLEQGRELERVQERMLRLEGRLRTLTHGEEAPGDPLEERPPHY